jgi:putative peptidoglycan lipid II flippase
VQLPALLRVGARWTPGFGWNQPDVRRVFRLMLPRVIDLGVFNFNMLMAGNFASRMGEGAVSAFSFGWALMQIPQTLIGTAMGMVIFPTLAALSELNDLAGKRSAMSGALRFILIGTIPAAIGLVLVGRAGISLLESGQFDSAATSLVYVALQGFALGIIFHSIIEVGARSFFADKDTITPLLIAVGGALVNLTVSLVFTGLLNQQRDPAGSLVPLPAAQVGVLTWANTAGVLFESILLLLILRRRWHGIEESALARTTVKTLAASLIMGVAIIALDAVWISLGLAGRGRLLTIVQVGFQVLIGAAVFIGAAWLLRLEELRTLLAQLLRRPKLAEVPV